MQRFGLIGNPVAGSGSPALFERAYGGRWPYDLIEGAEFEASWKRFLDDYLAINITAPFKEAAFRKVLAGGALGGCGLGGDCEQIPAEVIEAIGAINIAVKEADGLVHGYNSDFLGVKKILADNGFDSRSNPGRTALVVGFGGAGKAAAAAARACGLDTVICNRSRYSEDIRPLAEIPLLSGVADILIYTLGFPIPEIAFLTENAGSPQSAPLHTGGLTILEASYRTPCLAGAACNYIPGTEWLRAQAATGYPLMTGLPLQQPL